MSRMHSTRGRVAEPSSPTMSYQSLLSDIGNCTNEFARAWKKRRGGVNLPAERRTQDEGSHLLNSFSCTALNIGQFALHAGQPSVACFSTVCFVCGHCLTQNSVHRWLHRCLRMSEMPKDVCDRWCCLLASPPKPAALDTMVD